MRFIFLILFVLLTSDIYADVVTIDMSTWTSSQKVMTHAMSATILSTKNITYDKINVSGENIEVENPSSPLTGILTKSAIETEYAAWKIVNDAANAIAQQEYADRKAEYLSSEFKDIKIADIDAKIDSIASLSDMKVLLKKLVKYIISTE